MEEAQEVLEQGGTPTDDVPEQQPEPASSSKPPSGLTSSGNNSPRVGAAASSSSSPDGKGLGPRHASSSNGKVSAAGSEAGLPPVHRQSSNLANRIAAFASGVAPVRRGITNADEDSITVEEVLHKLETAGRVNGADKCELPVHLVRSAHQHLVAARDEAARTSKELAELKASRVQHIPPSTWIKREQKYKMEVEKFEHTIGQLRSRSDALERELAVLREGSNVRPLEEKIQELEHQLVAAAEEKTKVQSKFHELSIKHRQLIETSPQVATIWNEVLVQQAADGHNAAAMQRLVNFDLRHTAASPGVSKAPEPVSAAQSPGVSAAAAIYGTVPAAPQFSSSSGKGPATEQSGPSTPMQQPDAATAAAAAGPASEQPQQPQPPQTAEERAHALMAAVALEGLSPEASLAALQQLNYDLTMQLGCYQQMVSRLKDAMEQSDLEKAELEAEKMALEMQMAGGGGSGAMDRSSSRGWGAWSWRRSIGLSAGGPHPAGLDADHDDAGSLADGASTGGLHSLSSSRRSSMDLDSAAALAATLHGGGSGSNAGTPTKAGQQAAADGEASTAQQQQDPGKQAGAGAGAGSASSGGGLFAARRQRAAARAAAAAESLGKEVKELKRQVKSLQDENRYLVNNLVEIKMELAETQGANDQAKRALVRAMDKEACLDMQVSELRHMLDISTSLNQQYEQQAEAGGSMAAAGAAAAAAAAGAAGAVAAAAKAAVAAVSSTPNSAKAAIAAMQSPFGRAEPDQQQPAADVAGSEGGAVVDASAGAEALAAAADEQEPSEAAAETQQQPTSSGDRPQPQQPEHSHPEAVHSQPLQLSESSESFDDADDAAEEGNGSSGKGDGGGSSSTEGPDKSSKP